MRNVLLIGGCGFIGSNIARRLAESHNFRVFLIDVPGCDKRRIKDIAGLELFEADINDFNQVKKIIESSGAEILIHLVSTLLPNSSLSDYQNEISTVIKPTIDIIHICAEKHIEFVFFSSGGTIYGNSPKSFHLETDILAPISYYGLSKCNIENVILIESRKNNLNYLILRPSNPYGPGQNLYGKQGLIAVSIGKLLKNEPIEIFGDGNNIRDYIYIDDFSECVFQLLENNIVNEIYNIGSGKGYTNLEIIEILNRVSGKTNIVQNIPSRSGDVKNVILNINKLKKAISFAPRSLETGIEDFLTWCRNNVKQHTI